MTTFKSIDLTCPNCASHFSSEVIDLAETEGRKATDFRLHSEGTQHLPYAIHLCDRCGFAGPETWFAHDAHVSYDVKRHVGDELTPRVAGTHLSASDKYECAARVATWDAVGARAIADLWLRAAWCCIGEGDTEGERYYRRRAVRSFEESLEGYDGVARGDRAVITYLIGELWRRIGNTARANEWFDRVADEVTNPRTQTWIVRCARQQRDDPREWFV